MHAAVEGNRDAWNDSARHHKETAAWHELLQAVRAVNFSCFDSTAADLLAGVKVAGKDVIQLGCNNGRECLSLLALGARRVVGVDQSREFLAQARELAAASPHDPEYVEADVHLLPVSLMEDFDLALITIGVLNWMPDLAHFFVNVASVLRPDSTLLIYETHPFLEMFAPESPDPTRPVESYFRTEPFVEDRAIVYAGKSTATISRSYWFVHRLGDIVSGVIDANLQLLHLREYAHSNREDTYACYERQAAQLPMSFSLSARKRQ